jgi:hypothetical protein
MFAVNPHRFRPVSFEEFRATEARRATMMRLTTDRTNIAQAEAEARAKFDQIEALLATPGTVIVGEFVNRVFQPAQPKSARIAHERLRCIVLQDRETCPAWRWVPVRVRCIASWNGPSALELFQRLRKPAFRWERRA